MKILLSLIALANAQTEIEGMTCASYADCSVHNAYCAFASWDSVNNVPVFQCLCNQGYIHVTGVTEYDVGGTTYNSVCEFETG